MAGSAGPAVGGGSGARRPRRPLRRPRQARGNADPGTTVVPRGSNTMSGPRERRPGKDPTTQTGPRGSRPPPDPTGTPPTLRERVGFQSNAQTGGTRSTRNLRARGRMTGRGREPAAERALPAAPTPEGYSGASVWCWWGSWGDPGRGRVQICHKGAPDRDRSRRKPRNINDSSCAPRLDPGLCGRFGHGPGPDRVRTGSDWSHATRAPHLSQVPLLAAPPGAEHGAPGGSFRGAPDCEAVRTAQSCGNRRTHPGRGPERSSQGARIGSGPWAPLAPDPAAERPCNRFGHTPPHKPHKPHTPHSDTPRITFPEPFPDEEDSAHPDTPGITFLLQGEGRTWLCDEGAPNWPASPPTDPASPGCAARVSRRACAARATRGHAVSARRPAGSSTCPT